MEILTPFPSVDKIRTQFLAFEQKPLNDLAFFENAGGSYICSPSLILLENYLRQTKVQPYGAYSTSIAAGNAMDKSYQRIAQALNLSADWIHFGPSTSINTYILSHAFAALLRPGDAIIVTNQDHEANSGVWRRLAEKDIEIREWKIDKDSGHLDPSDLAALLDDKVRFVTFPHASNIVGEINPAKKICQIIHQAGALAIIDGVSYCPHGLPDLLDINPDIYFFSAYKTYGPHIGVMAVRPELSSSLPNQGHYFNDDKPRYRLTPAGPDHAQIAAMAGIADYIEQLGGLLVEQEGQNLPKEISPFQLAHNAIRAHETSLMKPLLEWLNNRSDLRLIGPKNATQRVPTISLALKKPGFEMAQQLENHGILAGGGHFYAQRTLSGLGIDPEHGVLRLSFVHYTSPSDIARLIAALEAEL